MFFLFCLNGSVEECECIARATTQVDEKYKRLPVHHHAKTLNILTQKSVQLIMSRSDTYSWSKFHDNRLGVSFPPICANKYVPKFTSSAFFGLLPCTTAEAPQGLGLLCKGNKFCAKKWVWKPASNTSKRQPTAEKNSVTENSFWRWNKRATVTTSQS